MPHALNTSYGEYSAGTRVEVLGEHSEGLTVFPLCETHPDSAFDVPAEFVTELRSRSDLITRPTREEKRRGLAKQATV